ncbi:MAG: zinc ABC transporter substrate-binding protein [Candidatus Levyibacteriota bacterium]|jgi:zinc/manganese transport system substrate-binding protein
MDKKLTILLGTLVLIVIVLVFARQIFPNQQKSIQNNDKVGVVAAENFYGDIVKQLGGEHVSVVSILSNPNVDPHEYESNVQNALAVTNANIVIENGLDYDTWIDKLLSASPNNNRILLVGGKLASHPLPDNPHVWYGIDNMPTIAQAITNSLKKVDPKDAKEFDANLVKFDASLNPLTAKMAEIKTKYGGSPVGLTETIYLYQTGPEGLNVLTPFEFERAIAEGNDPSVADVKTTNDQIDQKEVKILIYNNQTITPVTTNLQSAADQLGIPIVPVSETMPPQDHYQSWMMSQLDNLEVALQKVAQ